MYSEREGASPFLTAYVLDTICDALSSKGVFEALLGDGMVPLMRTVARMQPRHYLVDTYLEQSLMDQAASCPRAILSLDSVECHYLDHQTGGAWFRHVGMPEPCWDDGPDLVSCLAVESGGVRPLAWTDDSCESARLAEPAFSAQVCETLGIEDAPGTRLPDLMRLVSAMPLTIGLRSDRGSSELVLSPLRTGLNQRFSRAAYRDQLVRLLRGCGCDDKRLAALEQASFVYGFPFEGEDGQHSRRLVSVDLGYLTLRYRDGRLADVRAGILVTGRTEAFDGMMLKPMIAYQWHITDNCDQRCKHCYLFAEDAQAHCLSTPWDMLMRTLDEIEDVAARRHLIPMLAVSGGDPILHPRFWDLAAELKRRGIRWSAMGNPFHLSADACRRLRQTGCVKYQLSLDGLERFHDYLRKPGSYRATLAAIAPLRAVGIKVQLMATASRDNLDDILACMDLAVEHGADSFAFARYCATSPERAAELYPTPEEYRAFLLAYWSKKRAFERDGCKTQFKTKDHLFCLLRWELGDFEIPKLPRERADQVCGGCHLGAKSTIAVNGDLLACRRMDSVVGNLWTEHLHDVEAGPAMKAYAEVRNIKKCKDCELLMWCRGCGAVGYNATGDLQAADPMCWKE